LSFLFAQCAAQIGYDHEVVGYTGLSKTAATHAPAAAPSREIALYGVGFLSFEQIVDT
jgi:hypothetical protein